MTEFIARRKGTGSFYRRADGRWAFAVIVDGKRTARTNRRLCELLKVVRDQGLAVGHEPKSARTAKLWRARDLGTHTHQEWRDLLASTGTRCEYCGRVCGEKATPDHRTPLSRGGSDAIDNLAVACMNCNQTKNAKTEAEFRAWLDENPDYLVEVRTGVHPDIARMIAVRPYALALMSAGWSFGAAMEEGRRRLAAAQQTQLEGAL